MAKTNPLLGVSAVVHLLTLLYLVLLLSFMDAERWLFMAIGGVHFIFGIILGRIFSSRLRDGLYWLHIIMCIAFFATGYVLL